MSIEVAATGFTGVAKAFIAWVDDAIALRGAEKVNMSALHALLCELQSAAIKLPDLKDDDLHEDVSSIESLDRAKVQSISGALEAHLPVNAYACAFDLFDHDTGNLVDATLADDLTDIYCDLSQGIALTRARYYGDAVWHWRFTYLTHWGRHAALAQTAIWQYLSDNSDGGFEAH